MVKDNKNSGNGFVFEKENYKLFAIGFAILIVGFLLMVGGASDDPNVFNEKELFSFRRITLSPIVVVLGFTFIGYSILKKNKK